MSSAARTLTIRLDARRQAQVRRLAEREGVSEEEAVLRAVERVSEAPRPSMLDLAGDLIGSIEGPPDLSTNKVYMEGLGAKKRGPRTSSREDT